MALVKRRDDRKKEKGDEVKEMKEQKIRGEKMEKK